MSINSRIQLRRGTSTEWALSSTILASGEAGYDTDQNNIKIGNGASGWADLPWLVSSSSLSGQNTYAATGNFDVISFNVDDESALLKGDMSWDDTEGTITLGLTDTVAIHVGEHRFYRVRNTTGGTLYKGQVVYATGVHSNGIITPDLYIADGSIDEIRFIGSVLEDINHNNNGYVIDFGHLQNMDLDGSATNFAVGNETWSAGDILYAHPTASGKLTNVEPKHAITIAIILDVGNGNANGSMFVRPSSHGDLEDIHDIDVTNLEDNQFLVYNSGVDYWQPSSGLYLVDGQLGVGTSAPNSTLHVYSSTAGDDLLNVEGSNGSLFSVVDSLSGTLMSVNNAAGLPALEVNSDYSLTAGRFNQSDFVITSEGAVGIGTSAPSGKLHVVGDSYFNDTIYIHATGVATSHTYNKIYAHPTYDHLILQGGGNTITLGGQSGHVLIDASSTFIDIGNSSNAGTANQYIKFTPANTERMRITASGDIGIGTSTPLHRLDVVGTGNFSGDVYASGKLGVGTSSPNATVHAYSATSGAMILNVEGTYGSLFSVRDNLSGVLMNVNTVAGLPALEIYDDYSLIAGRYAQNDFVITAGGDIGMGIAAPSGKLHIYDNNSAGYNDTSFRVQNPASTSNTYFDIAIGTSTGYNDNVWFKRNGVNVAGIYNNNTFYHHQDCLIRTDKQFRAESNGNAFIELLDGSNDTKIGYLSDLRFYSSAVEKMVLDVNGNLGIGTTSPTKKIQLGTAGDVLYFDGTAGGGSEGIQFKDSGNTSRYGLIFPGSNEVRLTNRASGGAVTLYANNGTSGGGEEVRLTLPGSSGGGAYFSNGNVGIGTTSPTEKLHVYTTGVGQGALIGSSKIGNWEGDATYASFTHNDVHSTTTSYALLQSNNGTTFLNSADSTSLSLRINNVNSMVVDSSRSIRMLGGSSNNTWSSPSTTLSLKNSINTPSITFHGNDGSRIGFIQMSSSADAYYNVEANQGFRIRTNNLDRLYIAAGGNVGIGTTNPQYTLDVNGTSNLGGNVVVGGNLTVNGSTVSANIDTLDIKDPILTLGLASGNVITNDTYDRGLALVTNNGTAFMGWDNSADKFVMLSSGVATNSSGNYDAGTYGDLEIANLTLNGSIAFNSSSYNISWDGGTEYVGRSASSDAITIGVQSQQKVIFGTGATVFNEPGNDQDFRVESNNNITMLFVDAGNDRVGIGTAPSYTLDVRASNPTINIGNTSAGGDSSIRFGDTSARFQIVKEATTHDLVFDSIDGGVNESMRLDYNTGSVTFNETGADMDFRVEGSGEANALFVDGANGNVGIGTSSPSYKLDVVGTGNFSDELKVSTIFMQRWPIVSTVDIIGTSNTQLDIYTANGGGYNGRLLSLTAGSMSIRDDRKLAFGGTSAYLQNTAASSGSDLKIHATGQITLEGSNVGINNTSPITELDVSGVITASGGNSNEWNTAYSWGDHSSAGYLTPITLSRTMPSSVNGFVYIGTFAAPNGTINLDVSISVPSSGFSIGKRYLIASNYNETGSNWRRVLPISDGGFYNNDFILEAMHNGASFSLRIVRTSGTYSGTAYVKIMQLNDAPTTTFTSSTSTGSTTAATAIFPSTLITMKDDRVGVNNDSPSQTLDIRYPAGGGMALLKSTDTTDGLLLGDLAYSVDNSYQGIKHVAMTGSYDYMMISNGTHTFISAAAGYDAVIGAGGNSTTSQIRVKPTEVVVNDNSSSVDFRVESNNNANMLFVDGVSDMVGIGTSSPSAPLTVSSTANNKLTLTGGTSQNGLFFDSANGGDGFYLYSLNNGFEVYDNTSSVSRLRIQNNGNVGIGTTSPGAKLDVRGNATFNEDGGDYDFRVESDTNTHMLFVDAGNDRAAIGTSTTHVPFTVYGDCETSIANANGGSHNMQIIDNRTLASGVGGAIGFGGKHSGSSNTIFAEIKGIKENGTSGNYASALTLHTRANGGNLTERVRIDSAGNVGIGTTSPAAKLQVDGTIKLSDTAGNRIQFFQGGGSANDYTIRKDGLHLNIASALDASTHRHIQFGHYNGSNVWQPKVSINGYTGNTGFGTTTPSYRIDAHGDSATWTQRILGANSTSNSYGLIIDAGFNSNDEALRIRNRLATAELLTVRGDGNVGIGTTTPTGTLHVVGSIYVDNIIIDGSTVSSANGADFNLTSDGGDFNFASVTNTDCITMNGGTRSNGSVNLQMAGGAIGAASFAGGGFANSVGGIYSSAIAGGGNAVGGDYSFVGAGSSNSVNGNYNSVFGKSNSDGSYNYVHILGTGITATQANTTYTENIISNGNATISGHLSAATKSFLINHPTREGHKLQYGSLESPYHGVRLTGRAKVENGWCVVKLPEYISELVHDDEDVNIQLTNYRHNKLLYVSDINVANNEFTVKCDSWLGNSGNEFFWTFTAVRKDVQELQVEF